MEYEISDDGFSATGDNTPVVRQMEPGEVARQVAPEAVPMRARGLPELADQAQH